MKKFLGCKQVVLLLPLAFALSCGGMDPPRATELRAKLTWAPQDYVLVDCTSGENLWVDLDTLQPWWDDIGVKSNDGGAGVVPPPLYVEMRATLASQGPYGSAVKLPRAVVKIEEIRTITVDIPASCNP